MPYDHRSDIWSVGCVLYEMMAKSPPFKAQTMKGLYTTVLSGKYPSLSSIYSQDIKQMVRKCLQVKASERPTCNKILSMPGLLNHLTGTLEGMEILKVEPENLLKTIKMPRNKHDITERMP